MTKEIENIIRVYQWSIRVLIAALILTFLGFSYMVAVVIPTLIHSSMKEELDARHGVLLSQMQSLLDEEFTKSLQCPNN